MILKNIIIYFVLPVLSLSMLLIFFRLFRGPNMIDKIMALDLLVVVGIGAFSTYAVLFKNSVFVDLSLILALIAFLSTVAFTFYYNKSSLITF